MPNDAVFCTILRLRDRFYFSSALKALASWMRLRVGGARPKTLGCSWEGRAGGAVLGLSASELHQDLTSRSASGFWA